MSGDDTAPINSILHAGWLKKKALRTASKMSWKDRYFRLKGAELSYYKDDKARQPQHIIKITATSKVSKRALHGKYELELLTVEESAPLFALGHDDAEIDAWIKKISLVITILQQPKKSPAKDASPAPSAETAAASKGTAPSAPSTTTTQIEARNPSTSQLPSPAKEEPHSVAPVSAPASPPAFVPTVPTIVQTHVTTLPTLHLPKVQSAPTLAMPNIVVERQGTLVTFGAADFGQLGDGRSLGDGSCRPVKVELLRLKHAPAQAAGGGMHAACVTRENKLFVWGDNSVGQCGMDPSHMQQSSRPYLITALRNIKVLSVSCGLQNVACISDGGNVWSWGHGKVGQLGLGQSVSTMYEPAMIPQFGGSWHPVATTVVCGHYTTGVITAVTETAYLWGLGASGQLASGRKLLMDSYVEWLPLLVPTLQNRKVHKMALGDTFSAFIVDDGKLLVSGTIGMSAEEASTAPNLQPLNMPRHIGCINDAPIVSQVASGGTQLAVIADGFLYTAGIGWLGGSEGNDVSPTLVAVDGLDSEYLVEVACGGSYIVVRTAGGKLFAFGNNSTGSLGTCNHSDEFAPVPCAVSDNACYEQVESMHELCFGSSFRAMQIACGTDFTMAIAFPGTFPPMPPRDVAMLKAKLPSRPVWKQSAKKVPVLLDNFVATLLENPDKSISTDVARDIMQHMGDPLSRKNSEPLPMVNVYEATARARAVSMLPPPPPGTAGQVARPLSLTIATPAVIPSISRFPSLPPAPVTPAPPDPSTPNGFPSAKLSFHAYDRASSPVGMGGNKSVDDASSHEGEHSPTSSSFPEQVSKVSSGLARLRAKTASKIHNLPPTTTNLSAPPTSMNAGVGSWEVCKTNDGIVYYYNDLTEESVWQLPPGATIVDPKHLLGPSISQLPPEWKELKDSNGNTYYYNVTTRLSQWERPV